jgi:hypothetical protein
VGDAAAGEWWEAGDIALHLRRRLSAAEAEGLDVVDVRRTWEGTKRRQAIARYLPDVMRRQPPHLWD